MSENEDTSDGEMDQQCPTGLLNLHSSDDGAGSVTGGAENRTVRACEGCHRSKSKCINDGLGTTPCQACARKGIECVYLEQKKRGPKTGALKQLQEEVAALRQQLKQVTTQGGAAGASAGGAKGGK